MQKYEHYHCSSIDNCCSCYCAAFVILWRLVLALLQKEGMSGEVVIAGVVVVVVVGVVAAISLVFDTAVALIQRGVWRVASYTTNCCKLVH